MTTQVRVYGVIKTNGKWDVLNKLNVIPRTVDLVLVTWGDGKGDKTKQIKREDFLGNYTHTQGCNWKLAN